MHSQDPSHQPVRVSEPADLVSAARQMAADAAALASQHDLYASLLDRNGLPPLWRRELSFATLVRLILEQQVSLASANAAFARVDARLGGVNPDGILASTDKEMKADGFSRQKTSYVRGISEDLLTGKLTLSELSGDAVSVSHRLLEIRGVGPWTAACFLLFVNGERDVWPTGDRALYVSMARNLSMESVPTSAEGDAAAISWAPFRSTAAKMLWHDYLGGRSHAVTPGAGFMGTTGKVHT
ncbi:MAG: DNA-3-methyladenine glycosylase 2 family protein [Actinomycetota bacterium]